ncbi:MAG: hypothetical protein HWE14_03605 [Flavobacteriia bacterium]|nr:hypothetical protein [Flavobacteriia bacterium]
MRRRLLLIALFFSTLSFAQVNVRDSLVQGWLIHISASYNMKGGDFSEHFLPNFSIGGDLQYKWKSNWFLSVGGRYHFGDKLRDPYAIFGDLLTSSGELLALNGEYATVTFRERGWNGSVDVSYLFNQLGHNPNSGVMLGLGLGYNAHWIDVRNQQDNTPQIQDEYLRGYDRYTQGFMTRQYLGYHFAGDQRSVNFTIGFEFMQGFNSNNREYNYNTRMFDTGTKLDYYYGLRVSWFLPIYNENAQKFYYY